MSELKYEDLESVIKTADSSLVQLLALQLKNTMDKLEKSEIDAGQLIDERDAAELALADMYEKVTGEKPEWSNMFGFVDAVDVVDESIAEFERRLQEKDRLLEGVTQDAIDGGWTARGLSEHAVRVEKALANANDEAAHERNRRCKFEADCKALQQKLDAAEKETQRWINNYKHIIEQHMPRTGDGCDEGWSRVIEAQELQKKLDEATLECDVIRDQITFHSDKCRVLTAENVALKESRQRLGEFIIEEIKADYPLNMELETPATDAQVNALREDAVKSHLASDEFELSLALAMARADGCSDDALDTVIWEGQPPEPMGSVFEWEYLPRAGHVAAQLRNGEVK